MKKTFKYQGETVSITRDLNLKDKHGTWVQVEYTSGKNKKARIPVAKEELKPA